MSPGKRTFTRFRIFVLLWGVFVLVGGSAGYLIYANSIHEGREEDTRELATLARIMAMEIDPRQHEQFVRKSQQDSKEYRSMAARLEELRTSGPNLRYVYTMRKIGDSFCFIVDATPPEPGDSEGPGDTYLLDPYPDAPREAYEAWETASVRVTSEPYTDRFGTFLSAFAPIVNDQGRVVALLGVDREMAMQIAREWRVRLASQATTAGVILLAGILAWLISSLLIRHTEGHRTLPVLPLHRSRLRVVLLEATLYTLVTCLIVSGIVILVASQRDIRDQRRSDEVRTALGQAREVLIDVSAGRTERVDELGKLGGRIEALGERALGRRIAMAIPSILEGDAWKDERISSLRSEAKSLEQDLQAAHGRLERRLEERNRWIMSFAGITTLMALVMIVLIRGSSRQQQQLLEATRASTRIEGVYRQLVEQLPVGLFAYTQTGYEFYNPAWESRLLLTDSDDAWFRFTRALHPDDREAVLKRLRQSELRREPFELDMRLIGAGGETVTLNCRGVPVYGQDGEYEHMLAFAVDVTDVVHAGERLQQANTQLMEAIGDLESNFEATVRALVKAVDAKDPYTAGHSERATEYGLMIGRAMGLDQEALYTLEMGLLIHDIGKIGIPDSILTKPTALTKEEFEIIKSHAAVGHAMVKGIPRFWKCAGIVRSHHERLDGSGYPDGLKADQISLLVRIAAVADSFDAMTSTRAYRVAMDRAHALGELRKDAVRGTLDAKVVEVFAEIMEREEALERPRDDQAA